MLIVRDDGRPLGSVSGGCIEDDVIAKVRAGGIALAAGPWLTEYGVAAQEAHRFGLPCGGTIRLVMEPLGPHSALRELLDAMGGGRLAARTLDLASGAVRVRSGDSTAAMHFDGTTLVTVHGPRYRMLLIGGGELSMHVATTSVGLGYEVTVCDPREEYGDGWNLRGVRFVTTMPDDTVLEMRLDARSAVVALTHDPKLDDLALMEALRTEAFYVGAIGSRRNNDLRRERLRLFDLDDAALARLRGPVGLYIGSRTPAEIALSILAEITACKNRVRVLRAVDVATGKSTRAVAPEGMRTAHAP